MPASVGDMVLIPSARVVGRVEWFYENPVHRPGVKDRAVVDIVRTPFKPHPRHGSSWVETWCANRAGLIVVGDPED